MILSLELANLGEAEREERNEYAFFTVHGAQVHAMR
jgi:hypothetical protein